MLAGCRSRVATATRYWALGLLLAGSGLATLPAAAAAHGPVAPVASAYVARVAATPAGTLATAVDGDQRMWLSVPTRDDVEVIDYRGAPYLRFTAAGVAVNTNSEMYYLNLTPVAQTPPAGLTAASPPHWQPASSGHTYDWHDGRLHALATVARAPGASYVGRWRIPLVVNGAPASISGGLYYAPRPSLVWFWPIIVALACLLAAWRLGRPELDARLARWLQVAALVAIALAAVGLELHARPAVSAYGVIKLIAWLAFVAACAWRLALGRAGYFASFVIGCAAVWCGVELLPALLDGYVLIALPAFVARLAAVLALSAGSSLLLLFVRVAARRREDPEGERPVAEDDGAWELA